MNELTVIGSFHKSVDAELARLALAQAGITAFLDDTNLVGGFDILTVAIGGIRLSVATAEVPRSLEVLQALRGSLQHDGAASPGLSVELVCPDCGRLATFPAAQAGTCQVCPHCHHYVDVPDADGEPGALEADEDSFPTVVDEQQAASSDYAPAAALPNAVSNGDRSWSALPGDAWELLAVLALIWLPPTYFAVRHLLSAPPSGETETLRDGLSSLDSIVSSSGLIAMLLYLTGRRTNGWSAVGLVRPRWGQDGLLAVLALVANSLSEQIIWALAVTGSRSRFSPHLSVQAANFAVDIHADWPGQNLYWTLLTGSTLVSAAVEELMFRGYLISRLSPLLRSSWLAVAVSATFFAVPHLYSGGLMLFMTWTTGVVFGAIFLTTRRIWPLILAHAAHNLLVDTLR